MDKKRIILLIFLLTLIAISTYLPHFSYKLPYHLDEWDHIAKSIRIQEQGISYFTNNTPIEIGFDLILLIISKIISIFGLDIVNIYQFLPAINAIIISSILFFNLKKEYNYWLAISSFLFIILLPSNVNILGIWFYVPIMAGIPLIYLILFNLDSAVKEDNPKKLYPIIVYLFLLAFIHQSSFILILLIICIYLVINKEFLIENKKYFYSFSLLIIPALITIIHLTDSFQNISNFFSSFIWGPISPQINYNIISLYGTIGFILSFIGFYKSFKNKKLLAFRIYYSICLISILIFPLIEKSIFSAYQRYIYHFMFAAIPLSAVGLYHSFKWLKNKTNNMNKLLKYTITTLFILFIAISSIYQYSDFKSKTTLYVVLEETEIGYLQALSTYPPGIVLTPIDMGTAVKPITKKHEPALTFFDWKKTENLTYFYNTNCDEKEEYLYNENLLPDISEHHFNSKYNRGNIDYIISENPIDCNFTQLLEKTESYYIYKTKLDKNILLKINKFEEKDNIIIIPSSKLSNNFTLYAWVKPNLPTSGIIKSIYGDGYNNGWMIYTDKEYIRLNWGDGENKYYLLSKEKVKDNSFIFVALTYNGDFNLYIDGKIQQTQPAKFEYEKINLGLAKARVGRIFDKPAPHEIINLNMINRPLNEEEIKKIYEKEKINH
ncbi:MAG: LamG-like jellyroll fold domain-containing protein [Nanoarchaeota archaeon]|nr:LamG-like jellyroll fold domain-containing protein [Nanoarchaeota archaeon]